MSKVFGWSAGNANIDKKHQQKFWTPWNEHRQDIWTPWNEHGQDFWTENIGRNILSCVNMYMLNFKYQTSTCTMYSPSSLSVREVFFHEKKYTIKKIMFWEFLMQFSLLAVWCTSMKTLVSSLCVKNMSSLKNILKNPDEVKYEANFRECHQWLFGSCWWEGKLMGRDISYKCQRKNLLLMPCSHETVRLNKLL